MCGKSNFIEIESEANALFSTEESYIYISFWNHLSIFNHRVFRKKESYQLKKIQMTLKFHHHQELILPNPRKKMPVKVC